MKRSPWASSSIVAFVLCAAACTSPKRKAVEQLPEPLVQASAAAAPAFAPAPARVAATVDAGDAPPKPSVLLAKAVSPFAVRLTWDADARAAVGFEVQIKTGEAFVRAALLDATKRDFVHHLRLPKQVLTYRVRSFNAQGASEPSPPATLTMPERAVAPSAAKLAMGPCVPMPAKAPKSSGCDPEISTLDPGTGHVVYNVPGAGNGCMRHLMGEYAGCTRELGVFELQADVVVVKGHTDEGWPLLHAIAGAGQRDGAQIQTLQLSRGRYTVADEAHVCGEGGDGEPPDAGVVSDDLERCSPPFAACQRDPTPL